MSQRHFAPIVIDSRALAYDDHRVLDGLFPGVPAGSITALFNGAGTRKSTRATTFEQILDNSCSIHDLSCWMLETAGDPYGTRTRVFAVRAVC